MVGEVSENPDDEKGGEADLCSADKPFRLRPDAIAPLHCDNDVLPVTSIGAIAMSPVPWGEGSSQRADGRRMHQRSSTLVAQEGG